MGISEIWQNQIVDVIIGLIGFFIAYYGSKIIGKFSSILLLIISIILIIILNILGWKAYYK